MEASSTMSDTTVESRVARPVASLDPGTQERLSYLKRQLEADEPFGLRRIKRGVYIQAAILVFVFGYMTWLYTSMSKLDAEALTSVAATQLQQMIPELRDEVRNYAIAAAPELAVQAQGLFLELPRTLGAKLEEHIIQEADARMKDFEADLGEKLSGILDAQVALVKELNPGATAEESLDTAIRGVSAEYRDKMAGAIDFMYDDYSREVRKLDDYLTRLQTSEDLSETEKIDKELIEAWMVLLHKHQITRPGGSGKSW